MLSKSVMVYQKYSVKEMDLPPYGLQYLLGAYPEHITSITKESLIWTDGTEMMYDDGIKNKDFETMLNSPDLEDQMSLKYPEGPDYQVPVPVNVDPGRVRYEPFFKKMYGTNAEEVKKNLVIIHWMPETSNKRIYITSVNSIDQKLKCISEKLDRLPDTLKKYVKNPAGTFCFRKIPGTNRLSMHSFGIAIDINTTYSNYWKWDRPGPEGIYKCRNKIPYEIVSIFEKHGFIWGGKWYHYDTMHFEYRPELLIKREVSSATAYLKDGR